MDQEEETANFVKDSILNSRYFTDSMHRNYRYPDRNRFFSYYQSHLFEGGNQQITKESAELLKDIVSHEELKSKIVDWSFVATKLKRFFLRVFVFPSLIKVSTE